MEDLEEALSPRGLSITSLPDKGRALFTAKHFQPGEVIITQDPYVCVPNNSLSSATAAAAANTDTCVGCFASSATNNNFKKCSACRVACYCGITCQKLEWKLHRVECEALCRLDKEKRKLVTPSIRLMLELYLRRKLQFEKIIPTSATDNYGLVEALVSHVKDISEEQLVLYAQMANLVNMILQWPEINIKEIAENFSKLACNAHTICDSELRPLGTGLYPVISIINHSCLPNAVLVFEGRSAVVRAIQNIPKDSEVSISYIETAGSSMTRQKALKEQYFFTCTCPRCIKVGQYEDIRESAILEGYRCKDNQCNGFLLRDPDDKGFKCEQCGHLRGKEEIKKISSEIRATSEKASKCASSCNHQEAISLYKIIEELQMKLCHSFSITLMQTRDKLLKILMEVEDWRGALTYCRLTIPVYERVYPEFHPLLGLQYYTSGKLEWLLGDTDAAIKSLTKAVGILRITHGTNRPFIKELIMKLDEARAEASHKLSSIDE